MRNLRSALLSLLLPLPAFAQPADPPPAEPPPPAEAPPPVEQPAEPPPPAPPPAQPTPTGPPAPTPDDPHPAVGPAATDDEAESSATRISVGKAGFFEPSANIQIWAHAARQDEWATTFRVRRAELKIKGEIVPDFIAYAVMIDPAKVLEFEDETVPVDPAGSVEVEQPQSNVSVLQDAYITFITEYTDVSFGQMKNPLSWEGYNSASKLLFPERALASRAFGDERDIGIRFEKRIGPVYYFAGLYNGEGLNRRDSNDQKDATLRVEVFALEWLMLGAVGYTSIGERDQPTTRDVVEADLRIEYEDALLQAEYLRQWLGSTDDTRDAGHGFYAAVAYTFLDRIQPALRVGVLDPSVRFIGDHTWHYELGLNYYFQKHEAKLQASYGLFDPRREESTHEVILAAQVSF